MKAAGLFGFGRCNGFWYRQTWHSFCSHCTIASENANRVAPSTERPAGAHADVRRNTGFPVPTPIEAACGAIQQTLNRCA